MKSGVVLGFVVAILFHGGVLLFGGLLFPKEKKDHGTLQKVELMSAEDVPEQKSEKKEEESAETKESVEAQAEQPPDANEVIQNMDVSAAASATALEAASLSAIEASLNPGGTGGGIFSEAMSFASGGKIGGLAKPGQALEDKLESAFGMGELDQRPRAIFQAAPTYPAELRARKVEGVVQVVFVIDVSGKVASPRVEKSTNPAFDKPALDAVKQWRFEPAIKGGQRVPCKMRAPIRFQPS